MDAKLLRYKKYAIISRIFIFLTIIYLLMVVVKGMWIYTDDPQNGVSTSIRSWTTLIIGYSYIFPINYIWDYIPNIGISNIDVKTLYIVFIPPFVVFLIAFFFIANYKGTKEYERKLDRKVAEKLRLRKKEQEAGLYENQNPETININIETEEPKITPWHNKWWGKIILSLLVMLLATAIGLRTI